MKLFNSSRLNANPDGTFKDNDTANGIIGTLINASIFNQLGYETDNLIKAGGLTPDENTLTQILDAIKKLYGDADKVLDGKITNNKNSIDALLAKQAIPLYYIQVPKGSEGFLLKEEPANFYKNNFNLTTTWELLYNTDSMFFRTEGGDASSGRSSGVQPDAGRNAIGTFYVGLKNFRANATGVFSSHRSDIENSTMDFTTDGTSYDLTLSSAYSVANEFRVKNSYIRIWELITINGATIQ